MQRLDTRLRHRTSRIDDLAEWNMLGRLTRPLDDAAAALHHADTELHRRAVADAIGLVLLRCAEEKTSFWAWSAQGWLRLIGVSIAEFQRPWPDTIDPTARPHLVALAYLLGGFTDFDRMGPFGRLNLARRIFGIELVDHAYQQVSETLGGWGYRIGDSERERMTTVLSQLLLLNGSPLLADLTTEAFIQLRPRMRRRWQVAEIHGIQRAAASLGFCDPPSSIHAGLPAIEGTAESWATWVDRWHSTSTLTPKVRAIFRSVIAKAGRWLAAEHPEITEPSEWTRQTCAAWVATIDRLTVGEHVQRHAGLDKRKGDPISPRTKAGYLTATRTFFRDCQEWEWFPRRFDPARALATPRTIQALIGPNPRVIADDIWAKLLWAGLNIEADDLPANASGPCYPMELIRAITLTWLFSGQRSDEIARLRIGCIRWQHDGTSIPGDSRDVLAEDAVCLLDIPTHKTGTAFTKRVDPLRHRGRVGRAEGEGDRREDLGEAVAASGQGGGVCGVGAQLPVVGRHGEDGLAVGASPGASSGGVDAGRDAGHRLGDRAQHEHRQRPAPPERDTDRLPPLLSNDGYSVGGRTSCDRRANVVGGRCGYRSGGYQGDHMTQRDQPAYGVRAIMRLRSSLTIQASRLSCGPDLPTPTSGAFPGRDRPHSSRSALLEGQSLMPTKIKRMSAVLIAVLAGATTLSVASPASPAFASQRLIYAIYQTSDACKAAGNALIRAKYARDFQCLWDSPGFALWVTTVK